ncbi:Zinc finger C2H2-type [Sesbania bispinosa]|nr:Zinc finger C2H2-type [Sesbania bispinosa]
MEEDQELKHVCKFCSKSFPCGRSLGGHMRSHVTTITNGSTETEKFSTTTTKKVSYNGGDNTGMGSEGGTNAGYGLRENPKKTWRLTDSSEDNNLVLDKFCKECGKGFHSWKALFGHMKCHSEKERVSNNNSLDDQDSWTNNASQSDTEATVPNRRRRSKRRRTRYMTTPVTSSMSFVAANPSSSVSEAEQELEQEEVAMSLIMLSRDMSPWGGLNSFAAESSDNNSLQLEAPSKIEMVKVAKPRDNKLEFGNSVSPNLNSKGKSSELLANESPGNGFRMQKNRVFIKNGKLEIDSESAAFEVNETESVLSKSDINNNKYTSIKAKFLDSETKSSSLKNKNSHKRGKFECTTCNKIFHSYQALGGHRASHKKIKGCFASRNESSENSIELEPDLSPDPTTIESNKLMKNTDNNEYMEEDHELGTGFDDGVDTARESKKSSKGHECPICLKVFPSGQALGGHKRSHLASESESRHCQSQTVVLQEAVPEIRNFLDLNLPADTEEESNSHAEPYRPWWVVGSNHKQGALVGLMSN